MRLPCRSRTIPRAEADAWSQPVLVSVRQVSVADPEGGGGCLAATAAYGTELAPQVQALREYRDATLMATGHGQAPMSTFSAAHCAFSPHAADLER